MKLLEIELRKLIPYRSFWVAVLAYAILMPALFISLYRFNIKIEQFTLGFNFYNFRDNFSDAYYENELTSMLNNPEVTVRSRGVMEKCTFCVQRIMDGRSEAIKEGKEWNGQNMKTACQSACPAEAIVFGNVNDKNSEIYKYREHDLAYHVLEDLYVKPNVTYLAKLRNTITEES